MARRDNSRREPQIDVVLVSLAWLEELGTIEAVAETRSHDAILNALCPTARIDMLLRLLQNVCHPRMLLSGLRPPKCFGPQAGIQFIQKVRIWIPA